MVRRLRALWNGLSLAQQFAVASFAVLVGGMLVMGSWVNQVIKEGVTHNAAVTTALYVNSFVAPEVQELVHQEQLSAESMAALDALHRDTPLGQRIVATQIWGPGGRLVYSSRASMVGNVFPVTPDLALAWEGVVTAEISLLEEEEDAIQRVHADRLLETYSPIRGKGNDRVIAVAEFYEPVDELEAQLFRARVNSWIVVAGATLAMFGLLFGIVRGGSRTIARQQKELQTRISELSALLAQNQTLHDRVRRATSRAVELNESYLRRISAELHDGPAQALGFALLRLDAVKAHVDDCLRKNGGGQTDSADLDAIRGALNDGLQEIRNLAAGLALPEIGELSFTESLRRVVRAHERRTGSHVEMRLEDVPEKLPLPLKIGVYRLAQEALNNAYRHGEGKDQQLCVSYSNNDLSVEVSDSGPGFDPSSRSTPSDHLGMVGMFERTESLGGRFELKSAPGQGTRIKARFHVNTEEGDSAR